MKVLNYLEKGCAQCWDETAERSKHEPGCTNSINLHDCSQLCDLLDTCDNPCRTPRTIIYGGNLKERIIPTSEAYGGSSERFSDGPGTCYYYVSELRSLTWVVSLQSLQF